jgi:hypothetical protein
MRHCMAGTAVTQTTSPRNMTRLIEEGDHIGGERAFGWDYGYRLQIWQIRGRCTRSRGQVFVRQESLVAWDEQ